MSVPEPEKATPVREVISLDYARNASATRRPVVVFCIGALSALIASALPLIYLSWSSFPRLGYSDFYPYWYTEATPVATAGLLYIMARMIMDPRQWKTRLAVCLISAPVFYVLAMIVNLELWHSGFSRETEREQRMIGALILGPVAAVLMLRGLFVAWGRRAGVPPTANQELGGAGKDVTP
jgi:hypothetical protein